ncbi:MAG: EF-P lysine aminoacylase EpmA [Pseudomonadota bacterium]
MTVSGAAEALRWEPSAEPRALKLRAALNAAIRGFFADRGVLEVETPLLQRSANPDPAIEPLAIAGGEGYLRTSPEFAQKRLLCAGSGPIYELGRVFRAGEAGRYHHPEFTMLEWYRPGFGLAELISEVADLINLSLRLAGAEDLPLVQVRYAELLEQHLGAAVPVDLAGLRQACVTLTSIDDVRAAALSEDECLDLLFTVAGEALPVDQLTFVTHFPVKQAALARIDPTDPTVALRFEAFAGGMELANGYDELRSAQELAGRFADDNRRRKAAGLRPLPIDQRLLAAQRSGLPACSGVSVGVDRLLMLIGGYEHLHQVLSLAEPEL